MNALDLLSMFSDAHIYKQTSIVQRIKYLIVQMSGSTLQEGYIDTNIVSFSQIECCSLDLANILSNQNNFKSHVHLTITFAS